MALILDLPLELALQVFKNIEDKADLMRLRVASKTLAPFLEPHIWADLDLIYTENMVKQLQVLLTTPRLRRLVKTIRFPNFREDCVMIDGDRLETFKIDTRKYWSPQLDEPIWETLDQRDVEVLKLCSIVDDNMQTIVHKNPVDWSLTQALAAAITLICPNAHTLGLDCPRTDNMNCVVYPTLDDIWRRAIESNPSTGIRVPPITTVRLTPGWCPDEEWNLMHSFPAFCGMPPVKRLDLTYMCSLSRWTFRGLNELVVFTGLEDLRLDATRDRGWVREWVYRRPTNTRIARESLARTAIWPKGQIEFRAFLEDMRQYFKAVAGNLKRLHWFFQSPALNWLRNSFMCPRPWLPSLPELTSLTHLETDLASLFGRPYQMCHSKDSLVNLLPSSLKVVELVEAWYGINRPCRHRSDAYRIGLYTNLVGLVEAHGTQFPFLESVTLILLRENRNDDPTSQKQVDLGSGLETKFRWAHNIDAPERDPFGVLRVGKQMIVYTQRFVRNARMMSTWRSGCGEVNPWMSGEERETGRKVLLLMTMIIRAGMNENAKITKSVSACG